MSVAGTFWNQHGAYPHLRGSKITALATLAKLLAYEYGILNFVVRDVKKYNIFL
jgi:hypothetical protein